MSACVSAHVKGTGPPHEIRAWFPPFFNSFLLTRTDQQHVHLSRKRAKEGNRLVIEADSPPYRVCSCGAKLSYPRRYAGKANIDKFSSRRIGEASRGQLRVTRSRSMDQLLRSRYLAILRALHLGAGGINERRREREREREREGEAGEE